MLIYDIEIINAIPDKKAPPLGNVDYCAGWHDHPNMGISTICAYDYVESRYRVFCQDNFDAFIALCRERRPLVGYNNIAFDNRVIGAELEFEIAPEQCYDLLVAIWTAAGLGPKFEYPSHVGFSLDAVCLANFGATKTGHGALAPVDWQHGKFATVIDYCLNDVRLTKLLLDQILVAKRIKDPRTAGAWLEMAVNV